MLQLFLAHACSRIIHVYMDKHIYMSKYIIFELFCIMNRLKGVSRTARNRILQLRFLKGISPLLV